MQWGRFQGTNSQSEQQIGAFSYPIAFSSACYTMTVSLVNTDTSRPKNYDGEFQVRHLNRTNFTIFQQILWDSPWFAQGTYICTGK